MKIKKLSIKNFASYRELELDLTRQGLTLIHGVTGSGKSTVLDAIYWVLYGETSKGSNADEIRPWTTQEATLGEIELEDAAGQDLRVVRIRANRSDNDCYWVDMDSHTHRGSNLSETNRMLSERLGIDGEGFVGISYYHEFSPSGSFFTAKAKERRELFGRLLDLSFVSALSVRIAERKKQTKKDHSTLQLSASTFSGRLEALRGSRERAERSRSSWDQLQAEKVRNLQAQADNFETEKEARIKEAEAQVKAWSESHRKALSQQVGQLAKLKSKIEQAPDYSTLVKGLRDGLKCQACGAVDAKAQLQINEYLSADVQLAADKLTVEAVEERIGEKKKVLNPYQSKLQAAHALENHYYGLLAQERKAVNPYSSNTEELEAELVATTAEHKEAAKQVQSLEKRLSSLDTLSDLAVKLRASILHTTVKQIEESTNAYIERYFDGDLRVQFDACDDDIDVLFTKNGYACSFRQLSKGQRQLLRLSFWLASRDARSRQAGQQVNVLLLDEPTDGLSADMKVKAHRLFEQLSLEHDSVLVVEHSTEAKQLFENSYRAELTGDVSELRHE